MTGPRVWIVQISHPGPTDDEFDSYWQPGGLGHRTSSMYETLLGMEPQFIGYHKLVYADGRLPELGFEYAPEDEPPAWPDAARPAQVHVDVSVDDVAAAESACVVLGARRLAAFDDHVVLADPVGHPFCLFGGGASEGRIDRVVFDCTDPRTVAAMYEGVFGLPRVVDTPDRVELAPGEASAVGLAFQRSSAEPPRWPDPRYPAQLHLDVELPDESALRMAEVLGAVRLHNPARPDARVYADPGGHPFCVGLAGEWA